MGFSHLKSKHPIFVSCRMLCSNKIASHQAKLEMVVARWDLQNLSPLSAQKTPKLPLNLITYARNKAHIAPPVMCLYGSKAMNSRFLFEAGRRFFHGNGFQAQLHTALFPAEKEDSISFWKELLQEPKINLFCTSAVVTLRFCRLERIPYSKRYHWVLGGSLHGKFEAAERGRGDRMLKKLEEYYKGSIFPPNSPQSIRVNSILKKIVEAMHSRLRLQNSGKWKITRFATEHLDGMQWKVMVVESKEDDNAIYLSNGTILMFTGLLETLKSDAEVATVLGHEVGHGLARHALEVITRCYRTITILPLLLFIPYSEIPLALVLSFFVRRREMEADYIGMMLMASAGYDPRLAPTLFESRLNSSSCHGLFATYPSLHKRAKKLKEPKVMKQAMAIYNEATGAPEIRS